MDKKRDVHRFVENQKEQLGLNDDEVQELLRTSLEAEGEVDLEEADGFFPEAEPQALAAAAAPSPVLRAKTRSPRKKEVAVMTDPYLPQSQTIKARPTRVSRIRSFWFEHALPNEYIVEIGKKDAAPVLGGKFFKVGKKFLKFPAAVQTVYFTSDNANKNYQGLKIDGYACWRIDPERPEIAARTLDFVDQDNPMGNTNRILRTICTEAIRHLISNISIEEALTKKDEIGRDLKSQLERIERTWGITFDQVGIERVTILSATVFDDLQQKTRDQLRLTASESRMETDQEIERKKSVHVEEMERLQRKTEQESRILRATTESEIHRVELEEQTKRETEDNLAREAREKAAAEAEERGDIDRAERARREAARQAETEALAIGENQKVELIRAEAEADRSIKSVQTEAKVAEARIQSEMSRLEAEHQQQIRAQEWTSEIRLASLAAELKMERKRQDAELERSGVRFEQELRIKKEQAQADHDIEIRNLERFKTEEEILNLASEGRIMANLVKRLPEIAEAQKIDRYTVVGGGDDAPLTHFLNQILKIMESVREK